MTTMTAGHRRRRGVTAIEYGLLCFVIAVVIGIAVAFAGQQARQTYCTVAGAIGAAPGCSGSEAGSSSLPATFVGFPTMPAGTTCTYQGSATPAVTPPGGVSGPIMSQSGVSATCMRSDGTTFSTAQQAQITYIDTTTNEETTVVYSQVTSASGAKATVLQRYVDGSNGPQPYSSSQYPVPVGATCSMQTLNSLSNEQLQETGIDNPDTGSTSADMSGSAQVCGS